MFYPTLKRGTTERVVYNTILIAIGANLAGADGRTPIETCTWAADCLAPWHDLRMAARSRWYRSPAWPPSSQPDYVNGVVRLEGEADPLALLHGLHRLEADAGRVRSVANAARTLDLDLLAMDSLVLDALALVLPHPRMAERAFVLAPLCDVAPDWRHPALKRTAAQLFAALPDPTTATPLP